MMGAKPLENKEQVEEASNKKERRHKKRKQKYRIRAFPIWLRVIVVLILAIVALILGLMVGYGVIGDGNATDVLKQETWQHIVDIISKE